MQQHINARSEHVLSLNMSNIDEDSVDEILYLARANEASELEQFLTTLSTQISRPKDQIIAEAVDSYSQNTALHYAAANGHIGGLCAHQHMENVI